MKRKLRKSDRKKLSHALSAALGTVELANMQAGVYNGDQIEQLGTAGKGASFEIVLDGGAPVVLFEVVII